MSGGIEPTFNFHNSPITSDSDKILHLSNQTSILFLSDVHLGAKDQDRTQELEQQIIDLLTYCRKHSIFLVLLGDLFDYWLEYEDWIPALGRRLMQNFSRYHEESPATLYITGNHDHWHLNYLRKCGFDLESEFRILNIDNKSILLLHGDGLSDPTFKLPRSAFNRILRSDLFKRVYRSTLPPRLALAVMKYISRLNKHLESEEKSIEKSYLSDWAKDLLAQKDIDAVICGHNHNPQLRSFTYGTYLNPGAYRHRQTLGKYTNQKFELVTWDESKHTITPFKE